MVEFRPAGLGVWFVLVLGSLFLSPPSVCSSLPSTMTWAPCPHGVRTRGKNSWWSAYAPFPPRKHCWPLVQVPESLLSIDHWHRPAKLGAIRAGRVAHICQKHWVGHVSLAMFCFFLVCVLLEIARNLQRRIAPCKAGMVGWKPPVERCA